MDHSQDLSRLAAIHPETWQHVMRDVKTMVEARRFDALSELATDAKSKLARWTAGGESTISNTNYAQQQIVEAQMTIMAVEQFIAAFATDRDRKLGLWDRFNLAIRILVPSSRGGVFDHASLSRKWASISNKIGASAHIQHHGFWSIPTVEFAKAVTDIAGGHKVLEVACGRGLYISALKRAGADVVGSDDFSWSGARESVDGVAALIRQQDAAEAIREVRPDTVLSVWAPPGNGFEREIFKQPSVQTYVSVVSRHRFASGNWDEYRKQTKFKLTLSQELDQWVHPRELDQQVLIFRRIT